jgi:hypothetical protein
MLLVDELDEEEEIETTDRADFASKTGSAALSQLNDLEPVVGSAFVSWLPVLSRSRSFRVRSSCVGKISVKRASNVASRVELSRSRENVD